MDNSQPLAPAQSPAPTPVPVAQNPAMAQPAQMQQPGQQMQSQVAQTGQPVQVPQMQTPTQQSQPVQQAPQVQQPQAAQAPQQPPVQPKIAVPEIKAQGPEFFGYRPPKWANDFEHVRNNKGKGDTDDSETWLLYLVDRLLKKHSV